LIGESLESLIQNNVGGDPEAELFNIKDRSRNCSLGWNLLLFPFRKVAAFEI